MYIRHNNQQTYQACWHGTFGVVHFLYYHLQAILKATNNKTADSHMRFCCGHLNVLSSVLETDHIQQLVYQK